MYIETYNSHCKLVFGTYIMSSEVFYLLKSVVSAGKNYTLVLVGMQVIALIRQNLTIILAG